MKLLTFIISILLLSYIITSECERKENPKKDSDCKDLTVDTASGYKYCCYAKYEYKEGGDKKTAEFCTELKQNDYDKIKDYIKDWENEEKEYGLKFKKLDCHSVYLTGSILSLLLLLL